MEKITVRVTRDPGTEDLDLPKYQSELASGMDLICSSAEPVVVGPGDIKLISTGLHIELPAGYEAQIRPRSGLAAKHGITVVNAPGTIDADYRGEIKVILGNLSTEAFEITRGMRIAQMVIAPVVQADLVEVDSLDETDRAHGGFGHTGTK